MQGVALPPPIRHSFRLSGGRILSYYTSATAATPVSDTNPRPVLYCHGFLTCGLQGAPLAQGIADKGGTLFAMDRPGHGFSDPLPAALVGPDARIQAVVNDMLELAQHLGWTSFSLVGTSGGGTFVTAFLATYVALPKPTARLASVAIVAGSCFSAGLEGMMADNKDLFKHANSYHSSWPSYLVLSFLFFVVAIMAKALPLSVMMKLLVNDEIPEIDQQVIQENPDYLCRAVVGGLRQGGNTAKLDCLTLFRRDMPYEQLLKKHFESAVQVPAVGLFHGDLDVNVPIAHSEYVTNILLSGRATLIRCEGEGHASMEIRRAKDIAAFILK